MPAVSIVRASEMIWSNVFCVGKLKPEGTRDLSKVRERTRDSRLPAWSSVICPKGPESLGQVSRRLKRWKGIS